MFFEPIDELAALLVEVTESWTVVGIIEGTFGERAAVLVAAIYYELEVDEAAQGEAGR